MPYPVPPGPLCAKRMTSTSGRVWICVLVPHTDKTHWMIREDRLGL